MCDNNISRQLDEQRMLYVYQGLNVVMKLLSQHLDTATHQPTSPYDNADSGKVIGMAWQAYKNGKITHQQYEEIFDIATGIKTVQTTATSEPSWNEQYQLAAKYLNQYRR